MDDTEHWHRTYATILDDAMSLTDRARADLMGQAKPLKVDTDSGGPHQRGPGPPCDVGLFGATTTNARALLRRPSASFAKLTFQVLLAPTLRSRSAFVAAQS